MKDFERLTDKNDLYWALQETKLSAEVGIYLTDCLNRLCEYENQIEASQKIEVYYKPPYQNKYAIVKYYARKGQPLKVEEYYIYGEELKTNEKLCAWTNALSTNFGIIEDNFENQEEANKRLKEIKNEKLY